jgi:hypothetical protein
MTQRSVIERISIGLSKEIEKEKQYWELRGIKKTKTEVSNDLTKYIQAGRSYYEGNKNRRFRML